MTACFGIEWIGVGYSTSAPTFRYRSPGVHQHADGPGAGEGCIKKNILPYTRLGRLIEPSEIAETICFLMGLFAQPLEKVKVYPTSTNRCCHPLPAKLC